jgi:hypothetical protein
VCVAELYVLGLPLFVRCCLCGGALEWACRHHCLASIYPHYEHSRLTPARCEFQRSTTSSLPRRQPIARPGPFAAHVVSLEERVPPVPGSSEPVSEQRIGALAGPPSKDGTCGKQKGDTTCAGWPMGECCSMYGWCGNTGTFEAFLPSLQADVLCFVRGPLRSGLSIGALQGRWGRATSAGAVACAYYQWWEV